MFGGGSFHIPDWVLRSWVVPGLSKIVVVYSMADSASVEELDDSTIAVKPSLIRVPVYIKKAGRYYQYSQPVDTMILDWSTPTIERKF